MTDPEKINKQAAEETTPKKAGSPPDVGEVRICRRNFIGKMIAGAGGVVGAQMAFAGVSYLASKPKGEKKPIHLSLSDLPVDSRKKAIYGGNPCEVIRTEKGIKAFSLVCTHLGCLVIWKEERNGYHCPCHDGWFDADGNVISGPPPLPLEKIPVRVQGNTVIVGEE